MPDIKLTQQVCESLHKAPANMKERLKAIEEAIPAIGSVEIVEKKRSDYQKPNLWLQWRVS